MRRLFLLVLGSVVVVSALLLPQSTANSKTQVSGESVFKQNCAQCHAGGGNIVNQSKPLAGSQKLESFPTFKQYLQAPTGHMPFYKHIISDEAALRGLYDYCKTLKVGKQS